MDNLVRSFLARLLRRAGIPKYALLMAQISCKQGRLGIIYPVVVAQIGRIVADMVASQDVRLRFAVGQLVMRDG